MFGFLYSLFEKLCFLLVYFLVSIHPFIICIKYTLYFWLFFIISNFWIVFVYICLNCLIMFIVDPTILIDKHKFSYYLDKTFNFIFRNEKLENQVDGYKNKILQTSIILHRKINVIRDNIGFVYPKSFGANSILNFLGSIFYLIFNNIKEGIKAYDLRGLFLKYIITLFILYLCSIFAFAYYYLTTICNSVFIGILVNLIFTFITCTSYKDLFSSSFYITTILNYLCYGWDLMLKCCKKIMSIIENWGKDRDFDFPRDEDDASSYFSRVGKKLVKNSLKFIFMYFLTLLSVGILIFTSVSLVCFAISVTLDFFKLFYFLKS